MDVLKIVWTATALQQRNFIFHYWNKRNKSNLYSKKLNSSLKQRIESLKTHPNIGKPTEHKNTRVISLGHFSVFYRKIDSIIYITAFWDNRQNPKRLIDFLKGK